MATLSLDQRNYYYLLEAERTGIHKPILAALYQAHSSPSLADGQTGLGISPANQVSLAQVNTFPEQVQYAANTVRSLTDSLVAQGWIGIDLWNAKQDCYSDKFLQSVAQGYAPLASQSTTARLEACNVDKLKQAYLADWETDFKSQKLPPDLVDLEQVILNFVEKIPDYYVGLPNQRQAMLEAVRIWKRLDSREEAIAFLLPDQVAAATSNESLLDIPLRQFIQAIAAHYNGYPQQREALLRLTQLWRQLRTREEAIASLLTDTSPEATLSIIDPALIAFVEQLPDVYQGRGSQRNALVETFRLWHKLDSRAAVLLALGINPELIERSTTDKTALVNLATQLDRELLRFVRRLPGEYQESDHQREALIRSFQLWRNLATRNQTLQLLIEQTNLEQMGSNTKQAFPKPRLWMPKRPNNWTPENIQIFASIIEDGNFSWVEATNGGKWMPPDQATVDAIVRIAKLAQRARDRIGRPFIITSWYRPSLSPAIDEETSSRERVGDALSFVCEGLSANQVYWALDPWWSGGLGRSLKFPYLCHIDARSYRARWLN
ncbi:MAG TPA: peptidase M15A [Candidatus Sericytochromatia bacterium]